MSQLFNKTINKLLSFNHNSTICCSMKNSNICQWFIPVPISWSDWRSASRHLNPDPPPDSPWSPTIHHSVIPDQLANILSKFRPRDTSILSINGLASNMAGHRPLAHGFESQPSYDWRMCHPLLGFISLVTRSAHLVYLVLTWKRPRNKIFSLCNKTDLKGPVFQVY